MKYNLMINKEKKTIKALVKDNSLILTTNKKTYNVSYINISDNEILLNIEGQHINAFICNEENGKTIIIQGRSYTVLDSDLVEQNSPKKESIENNNTIVCSPMPAIVISILIQVGDKVKKGQGIIIVSAMKMETTLFAPFNGTVSKINTSVGNKVMPNDILIDIKKP